MTAWHELTQHGMDLFNLLIILYFFAANGVYTILMAASLASVVLHNRRLAYEDAGEAGSTAATPPVTIIVPAHNEEHSILETVRSALEADYPDARVVVVVDGSTDETLARLTEEFQLSPAASILRPEIPAARVDCCYANPDFPRLIVVSKVHGGKADALNAGINFCRTPYFCTLDADCLIEPDALFRLMRPIIDSPESVVVSGGVVRILNGCEAVNGRVRRIGLPRSWIERLQVVEYLRNFLLGRAGWGLLGGTLIVSGAIAVFERQAVIDARGFDTHMVSEDMELIVRLHHRAGDKKLRARMSFTLATVCWTECPKTLAMLARQRRRWHLGLWQTLQSHLRMNFNPRFGIVGMFSFPFHLFVEGLGAPVELVGYLLVPLAFILHVALLSFYIPLVILSLVYASLLSVAAVLTEELLARRYPARGDLYTLLKWSLFENFGFRQLILWFRFQGFVRFLTGNHRWEKVAHTAGGTTSPATGDGRGAVAPT